MLAAVCTKCLSLLPVVFQGGGGLKVDGLPCAGDDVQGQGGNPGEIFGILIHRLLPLRSFFLWTVDQELDPWSCSQWGPFAYAKRPAESAGLTAVLQQAGPVPSLYLGLGRMKSSDYFRPSKQKKKKKENPNKIIPFTVLAIFQFT